MQMATNGYFHPAGDQRREGCRNQTKRKLPATWSEIPPNVGLDSLP